MVYQDIVQSGRICGIIVVIPAAATVVVIARKVRAFHSEVSMEKARRSLWPSWWAPGVKILGQLI